MLDYAEGRKSRSYPIPLATITAGSQPFWEHTMTNRLTPEAHKRQIEAYAKERPHYKAYAEALERVLRNACALSVPEAIVQSRPKGLSSFAEKCIRKFDKYGEDAIHRMTDLCGARVIVHTLEQVKAVRLFIEAGFRIIERDDKGLLLGETTFGYRDMHYLVKLNPDRATAIGFTAEESRKIGNRIAEVQVRSLVQHAWADILHDRMYKAPLRLSPEAKRTGALLAAIMEDGDRTFNRIALEMDGMTANYNAYASREDVEKEIEVREQILGNEPDDGKKPAIAIGLARLLGPCGQFQRIAELLKPYGKVEDPVRDELLLELGYALCRVFRESPESPDYHQGQGYLREVKEHCVTPDLCAVPNLRRQRSLLAKACSRLAWSWANAGEAGQARVYYRQALETEPDNPYYLANQLGFEIYCERNDTLIQSMRTTLLQGIETCREHAISGTELPYALFTAGRLNLLLGQIEEAISWYARGLRHFFDGLSCVSDTVLEDEMTWIDNIHFATTDPVREHEWIRRLITLACSFSAMSNEVGETDLQANERVLIVAGGAATMAKPMLERVKPLLESALTGFHGTVISGGTDVGIPGCVGEVAAELAQSNRKQFILLGYIPEYLPQDAPKNPNYDGFEVVSGDMGFSPGQILRTWEDLLEQGYTPAQITVLGFGGGALAAVEYRVALALGATVGVVQHTEGAADTILADPVWSSVPRLLALPIDKASTQALTTVPEQHFEANKLEEMAQVFHSQYALGNPQKLPPNMQPWDRLCDTFRTANLEQARYAVEILQVAGFKVKPAKGNADIFAEFTADEVEVMAELEHGRWNIERLRDGWRPGKPRDDTKKIHDCLVPWSELPEEIREYDRNAVRAFPEILAKTEMAIVR